MEPTKVWGVRLRVGEVPKERRGTLSLLPDAIEFDPGEGEPHRIALTTIRKAKRLRGSPVLLIVYDRGRGPERTAFYFVQPPPLEPAPASPQRGVPIGFARSPKRKARRENVGYLGTWNREKKLELRAWQDAIRRAMREGTGSG